MEVQLSLEQLCGQLIVGGFAGETLPESYRVALGEGRRAGAILFRRNVSGVEQVARLNASISAAAPERTPPFVAVDQEGGRVGRLPPPFVQLPAMRQLGRAGRVELTRRVGKRLGKELAALGFNLNFAPVMDVDTNPDNPVIGDRSFGRDARTVAQHGVALTQGLQQAGVLACAKHFPGHGDTSVDSHLDLPSVAHSVERIRSTELPPFRAASGAGVAAMMSAHVVYEHLDASQPATFSAAICTRLLRNEMGFEGVLFSDDMEMGAIAKHHGMAEAALRAVRAGCDVLLICSREDLQDEAHAALVQEAAKDPAFEARCRQAAERSLRLRRLCPPRHGGDLQALDGAQALLDECATMAGATS